MGFLSGLTSLFSSGLSSTVDSIGKAIDDNVTSDEERLILRNELEKIKGGIAEKTNEFKGMLENQVTDRHKTDMASDSWLSKNIRPMTLMFLLINTMIIIYITIFSEVSEEKVNMVKAWIPLLVTLDLAAVGFYFTLREVGKATPLIAKAIGNK